MVEHLVLLLVQEQDVTEELKAQNQMRRVGIMNNIRAMAEKVVVRELIYIVLYRGQVDLNAMEKAPIDVLLRDYDGPWAPIYFRQTSFSRVDLMQAKNAIKTLYQGRPGVPQLGSVHIRASTISAK